MSIILYIIAKYFYLLNLRNTARRNGRLKNVKRNPY